MSLAPGALIEVRRDRRTRYFRHICTDEEADCIYLFDMTSFKAGGTRMPRPTSLSRFSASTYNVVPPDKDPFIFTAMRMNENGIRLSWREARDKKWKALEKELSAKKLVALCDRRSRALLLTDIASKVKETQITIRRWVSEYFYFGCNKNALIGWAPARGAPGTNRIGAANKRGRHSAVERLAASGQQTANKQVGKLGSAVSPREYRRYEIGLKKYWAQRNLTFRETYRLIVEKLGGKSTFNQFNYYKDEIINRLRLKELKAGRKGYREKYGSTTGLSSDIASDDIDIYDVDATPFPMDLLGGWDKITPIKNPQVLIAVERRSKAIVGFYDSLTPETWDCYRMCLFNAFTPKNALLAELGLDESSWPLYGVPRAIFLDNGPGMSEDAKNALVDELRLERLGQPSNFPMAKGLVEGAIGLLEHRLADLDGAWTSLKDPRSRERRRKALQNAIYNLRQFRRKLVEAIIAHNREYHLPEEELTPAMVMAGAVTPERAFQWFKEQRDGDNAVRMSDGEIYLKLLHRDERTVTRDGVKLKNHHYTSASLREYRYRSIKISNKPKNPIVTILEDPFRPGVLYWINEDGKPDELKPKSRAARAKLLGASWYDMAMAHDAYLIEEAEIKLDAEKKKSAAKREKKAITNKQTQGIAKATGVKIGRKPRPSEVEGARKVEQYKRAAEVRNATKSFLPNPDCVDNTESLGSSPIPKVSPDDSDGIDEAFNKMFGE